MKICKTHPGKEFKLREGKGDKPPFYSHVISGTYEENNYVWHSVKLDSIDKEIATEVSETSKSVDVPISNVNKTEEKVDWDAKDRQSMAQTAMKSASEIISAMLNAGVYIPKETPFTEVETTVKDMANHLYSELLSMKKTEV